ncbi:MAG: hypothetical protein C4337_09910 [Armatimonadota bacterium]
MRMQTSWFFGLCLALSVAQEDTETITFQYRLKERQQERYQATVELNGNLPIPGAAGMAGSLKLNMTVLMKVDKVESEKGFTVQAGLEAFDAEFNGQPFPVGLDMAKNVIPDSTATVHPAGKISGIKGGGGLMGFQLPGFDPRNLVTMLVPTEFPEKPLKVGDKWEFARTFGEGDNALRMPIKATFAGFEDVDGKKMLKVTQDFNLPIEAYQDAFYQPTTDKDSAARVTRGTIKGTMTLWYHPEDGLLYKGVLSTSMDQTTEPIKKDGSEVKDYERESSQLTMSATIVRKEPKATNVGSAS